MTGSRQIGPSLPGERRKSWLSVFRTLVKESTTTMVSFKMSPCVVLVCVVLTRSALAITGGSKADMCDYPGAAALVAKNTDTILCSGVTQEGDKILIPELCKVALDKMLQVSDVDIKYGNGDNTMTLPKGSTVSGSLNDGVWELDLPEALSGPCETPPKVFDSSTMELDPDSCEMAGFGADKLASKEFDKADFKTAPVEKGTSSPCCKNIKSGVSNMVDFIVDESVNLNCLTSPGSGCSVADVGAPVYCDTKSGEKVVVALTGTAPCAPGEKFVAHDLTSGDPKAKFGVGP